MLLFRNFSIRTKLTLVIMLASMLIHICVSSVYLAVEAYSSRSFLTRETATLASSLGTNSKDLLLKGEYDAAAKILTSLTQQKNIRAAYLFDKSAKPVAEYLSKGESQFVLKILPEEFSQKNSSFWSTATQLNVIEDWQHIGLFLPITHEAHRIGTIYLLSDLNDLYGRLSGVLVVVLLSIAFLLLISYYLAGKLQRPVSRPLLTLVETMGKISQQKDYTIRAKKEGQDEIGMLVEGFNRMLTQIDKHRQQLIEHQESLEQTVHSRTAELREMVEVLEHAKQQAVLANEAKSSFLANITHELRTPLIGVLGMNELLFRTQLKEQQRTLVETVQKSGEDLLSLINDVLDFSKIEAGELQFEVVEFSLSQTVEDVLSLLAGPAAEKGLMLYNDTSLAATCTVTGDEGRVRQILVNLVGNAIKFTESGSVTVKVIRQAGTRGADIFTIEVADTGIGMTEVEQRQIFNAFYQTDGTSTRQHGGTGLGLSIVLKLIEQFGGTISLESSVGEGSRFVIDLPLPVVAETEIFLPETLEQSTLLVCLVDKDCQRLFCDRVSELGITVVAAKSTIDAWYQLRAAERAYAPLPLAVISVDAQLPDGQPLYQAVRGDESCSSLRQIVVLPFNQSVELRTNDAKLYLPFSWSAFHQTLCRSWQELRLIENPIPVTSPFVQDVPEVKLQLLLIGASIASRELIKLSLQDLPVSVIDADSLRAVEAVVADQKFDAVFIDLNTESDPLMELDQQVLNEIPFLFILHNKGLDLAGIAERAHGRLEKPISNNNLKQLLRPVLNINFAQQKMAASADEAQS